MASHVSRLAEFLPFLLSVTSDTVNDVIAEEYRVRLDLKLPESRVVAVLGDVGPLTQRDLVRATQMDKVAVNRACKLLEERGLVRRQPHYSDGRSHHLELTLQGRSMYNELMPLASAIEQRVFADLSDAERRQLAQLLGRIRTTVKWLDSPRAA